LGLTKEEQLLAPPYNMAGGPAKAIAEHVQELKGMYHLRLIRPPFIHSLWLCVEIHYVVSSTYLSHMQKKRKEKKGVVSGL